MFRVVHKPIRHLPKIIKRVRKPVKGREKDIKYETKMAHKLAMKSS